ncbi:MAG: OmpA family protein [Acidobacteria bacterium]|nr:OmpA family protein [Acidobacteriota bacterium]
MRFWKTMLATILLVLFMNVIASAQEDGGAKREERRITQPTVSGATGLFTVYDSSTLKKGEINVGFFANNYDRDPGDVDIMQFPVNIAVGVTNRLELFLQTDGSQRVISNAPFELSGPLFPGLRQPQGSFGLDGIKVSFPDLDTDPRFFPLNGAPISGAIFGGVLPGLPQTGSRPVFDPVTNITKPGFMVPGYLNDFPFLGKGGNTLGNATFGAKFRFTEDNRGVGFALLTLVRVPTVPGGALFQKERGGRLAQGSGAGATDFGLFLITSLRKGIVSTHLNFGFMHANDPKSRNFKLIDRSDSAIFSAGVDVPINKYVQLIGETTATYYIGDATKNLNRINPVDVVAGARFFPFGKREDRRFLLSFGGAYRYFTNNSGSERQETTINPVIATGLVPADVINRGLDNDYNGFVANVTLGLRNVVKPPPPPPAKDPCAEALPPSVELNADKLAVKERSNDTVKFTTRTMGDGITYNWTATGGTFTDNDGAERTWSSANLAPGTYTITVTVTDKCNKTKSDTRTITVEKGNRCPTVSLRANPTSAQEGADVTFNFTASGNDQDGDKLQYVWTTTRGTLSGGDAAKQINSTGLSAGDITVKVTVSDGQCSATDSVTVSITPRPAPPQVVSFTCTGNPSYKTPNSTRVDNACKRVLDDVEARLRNDRNATIIIEGHSDKGEKAGTAKTRAERVRDELINVKNVDAGRIEIRVYDNQRPDPSGDRNANRRVIIHIVPQGAARPQ